MNRICEMKNIMNVCKIMTLLLYLKTEVPKKYKNLLTENEYKTLTQKTYKISNFYMLPKLHKSKKLNDMIMVKNSE